MKYDFPTSVMGTDGKTYPAAWLSAVDCSALVEIVHRLHCRERLSVRQLLACIQAKQGIRRSIGWAAGVLKNYKRPNCSGVSRETPEQLGPQRRKPE
jgi:hypothetical protein